MYIKYFVLTHEIIFSRREVNHPRDRLEASDKDGKVLLRVGLGTVDYKCTSDWGIQSALAVFVHGYLKTSKSYLSWITIILQKDYLGIHWTIVYLQYTLGSIYRSWMKCQKGRRGTWNLYCHPDWHLSRCLIGWIWKEIKRNITLDGMNYWIFVHSHFLFAFLSFEDFYLG